MQFASKQRLKSSKKLEYCEKVTHLMDMIMVAVVCRASKVNPMTKHGLGTSSNVPDIRTLRARIWSS